ncbi:MAG TPA: FecR domain-containing protein [Pirellulaceae bacterium]
MKDSDQIELLKLLARLCDERLDDAEAARLEALLADEEARRIYAEYMDVEARLLTLGSEAAARAEDVSQACEVRSRSSANASPVQRKWWSQSTLRYVAVAATSMAATVLAQWLIRAPAVREMPQTAIAAQSAPKSYVATLTQTVDAQWGAATQAYHSGSRVLSGEFELRQGVARLAYDGGIELIVEGPARLRLESESSAEIISGKVVFRADDASAPFRLSTPTAVLIDLGTEYAVEVAKDREEIHVFSGEVQRLAKSSVQPVVAEVLEAGEARVFVGSAERAGEAADMMPQKFVRQLPQQPQSPTHAMTGLLAYEGFDYAAATTLADDTASGGAGFVGPWGGGFARAPNERHDDRIALDVEHSLTRQSTPAASIGGSFEHIGFAKYFRRLATPIRLDADGVYYFSFLLRREGPPLDPLADVSIQLRETQELAGDQRDATIDLRKRLNFGVDRTNELFTHLERIGRRMPLPLSYGETYLLVTKVAASGAYPDQAFLRIYGPQEPVDGQEPATWTAVGAPVQSDLVFDWLEIHINSHTRQAIDEIRIGTTWEAVTAAWVASSTR